MQRHLANGLARFWRAALAEGWPELHSITDQDIAHRATTIATQGIGRTLRALHPDMNWTGDAITLATPRNSEIDLTGRDLVLTPSVLNRPRLTIQVDTPGQFVLYYPAQHIGTGRDRKPGKIAHIIGKTRAALLTDLTTPRTTTELATRNGCTPATASYHLTALHHAHLVTKTRNGRHVLYQRTTHAAHLLEETRD
ncbi:hypothetical protein SRB5_71210 [Streptomyces sp. RB5]|uniref:HTH arsR-type domain-containing protein n=1 Tax=Streptomyces smaragdinus TaxID=2585196 RepID=A0A7K0CTV7_9ACTN|nr:hypothetical protein [Streptomyces smaragdinus]